MWDVVNHCKDIGFYYELGVGVGFPLSTSLLSWCSVEPCSLGSYTVVILKLGDCLAWDKMLRPFFSQSFIDWAPPSSEIPYFCRKAGDQLTSYPF